MAFVFLTPVCFQFQHHQPVHILSTWGRCSISPPSITPKTLVSGPKIVGSHPVLQSVHPVEVLSRRIILDSGTPDLGMTTILVTNGK